MERLRFDPYAPASARFSSRHAVNQTMSSNSASHAQIAETASMRTQGTCDDSNCASNQPYQQGLARAFIIPQESVFPQFETLEGWCRGTMFTSLDKPLEGVNRCGTK